MRKRLLKAIEPRLRLSQCAIQPVGSGHHGALVNPRHPKHTGLDPKERRHRARRKHAGQVTGGGNQYQAAAPMRSEEHTSALPSIMGISSAVVCLKKKKHNTTTSSNKYNTT